MKNTVEKTKHGRLPKSSKSQEMVAKSSSKIHTKVPKPSSKAKPLTKVFKASKSSPKNVSKSSQKNSSKKSLVYYEDENEDENEDANKDANKNTNEDEDDKLSQNQCNLLIF